MSLAADGQHILCDGEGCKARARLPVGLRPVLKHQRGHALAASHSAPTALGWLCVTEHNLSRHFCPACSAGYLSTLSENVPDGTRDNF